MKIFFLSLFLSTAVCAEPLRVAVIDTGLDLEDARFRTHLCKTGHEDFTGEGIRDYVGHGTAIVGLIQEWAKDSDYCIVMLKYFRSSEKDNFLRYMKALSRAVQIGAYVVNMSLDTGNPNSKEINEITTHPKTTFIIAAGNQGLDLDNTKENPYLASYPLSNIISVGNGESNIKHDRSSNYGWAVKSWIVGEDVEVEDLNGQKTKASGTSFSCAIRTGQFIYAKFH